MKTVILTGPIGSGKSAVAALLRERGIPVYDSDSRTRQLYDRRPALLHRIEEALQVPLQKDDGSLDRRRLAALIFGDGQARQKLESLVYPAVRQDFLRWKSRQKNAPFVVLESAVILSKPAFDGIGDAVVLVTAPEELRIQRVMDRDGLSRPEVLRRMATQAISEDRAQLVLTNDGTEKALAAKVERVFLDKNAYICKILNDKENENRSC